MRWQIKPAVRCSLQEFYGAGGEQANGGMGLHARTSVCRQSDYCVGCCLGVLTVVCGYVWFEQMGRLQQSPRLSRNGLPCFDEFHMRPDQRTQRIFRKYVMGAPQHQRIHLSCSGTEITHAADVAFAQGTRFGGDDGFKCRVG